MRARIALALSASLYAVACGGDEDGESSAPPPARPASAAATRPAPGKAAKNGKNSLATYMHVEEVVGSAEEAARIRHQFRDQDFLQDLDGDNRDPFRSFILSSGILDTRPGIPVAATDVCTAKQMVATNYSIRDLKLVGIVSRGLRRYALMQDSANFGQIVTRGDCVGKEKARVKEIGAGYVTLEVMPETGTAGVPRVAEERSIPLYPEELPMSRGDADEDLPVPVVAPQPAAPAAGAGAPGAPTPAPAGAPTPAPAGTPTPARLPAPVAPAPIPSKSK